LIEFINFTLIQCLLQCIAEIVLNTSFQQFLQQNYLYIVFAIILGENFVQADCNCEKEKENNQQKIGKIISLLCR